MYKKKKVEISFEVVEWVDDDSDNGYGNNVDEWLGHLKDLVDCLDYRAEYEVDEAREYRAKYGKLKNTGTKIEITEAGCLLEDEKNEDELWERYGDEGTTEVCDHGSTGSELPRGRSDPRLTLAIEEAAPAVRTAMYRIGEKGER